MECEHVDTVTSSEKSHIVQSFVIHNFFSITKSLNSLDFRTVVQNKHSFSLNAPPYMSQYFVGFNFREFCNLFLF